MKFKKLLKLFVPLMCGMSLIGCSSSSSPSAHSPTQLSAKLDDESGNYYTGVDYTVTFSCSPHWNNVSYPIDYILDDAGGTDLVANEDGLTVNSKLTIRALNPGTAKFHFKFGENLLSNTIEMTFNSAVKNVGTVNEFLDAIQISSPHVVVNITNDLDFTGITYTSSPSFTGQIKGNGHTIKNIDYLTTTKNDCLSLIKNFSGILEDLNFSDCKLDIVAECSKVGVFASTSSGTIKNVQIDNIKIDSNLVSTIGSLVGYVEGGTYENITATNLDIKCKSLVGGIFGDCTVVEETTLKNITASGDVHLYDPTESYLGGVTSVVCNNKSKNGNGRITVIDVMADNCDVGQAYEYTGGVIGFVRNADISFTKEMDNSSSRVVGVYGTGGLYGYANNSTIKNAVNRCEVYTGYNGKEAVTVSLGGIVGKAENCDITHCKNYGLVTVISEEREAKGIGGIVGWVLGDDGNRGSYYYLENYGSIDAHNGDSVGGIVGRFSASGNRTMGFLTVDVDYIKANNCCGAILGYVQVDGTFSLNNSTYKYNICTYNEGHCDKEQANFQPAIGGYSYYKHGSITIQMNNVENLNE